MGLFKKNPDKARLAGLRKEERQLELSLAEARSGHERKREIDRQEKRNEGLQERLEKLRNTDPLTGVQATVSVPKDLQPNEILTVLHEISQKLDGALSSRAGRRAQSTTRRSRHEQRMATLNTVERAKRVNPNDPDDMAVAKAAAYGDATNGRRKDERYAPECPEAQAAYNAEYDRVSTNGGE